MYVNVQREFFNESKLLGKYVYSRQNWDVCKICAGWILLRRETETKEPSWKIS